MLMSVERDPRTMNHMDPESKVIHARLEAWASWAKDAGIAGYPKQSLTEKAALYGKLGLPQEPMHKPEPMMPDQVAAVDAAVARLWKIGQRCVHRYYTSWEAPEVMARKEGMRLRQFQEVLRRSRWLIGSFLEQAEKNR